MITFEEYMQGLKELQEEHELKAVSARQSSLILDRIIKNAQKEKEQLRVGLDNHTKEIIEYQKRANKDNKFIVKVGDLMKALAKVYKVRLRDVSANINLYSRDKHLQQLDGYVSIDVKYDDAMCYKENKITQTYCIGVNNDTKFADGTKLKDNLEFSTISLVRTRYCLPNGKNVKDLNVVINLTNGYMDDRYFVEALKLCFKNQEQTLAQ